MTCPQIDNRPVMTAREAAARAGCTRNYIGMLCRSGAVEGVLLRTSWMVFSDSLERFLADRAIRKERNRQSLRMQRLAELACGTILPA